MDLLRSYRQTRAAEDAESVIARFPSLPALRHRLVLVVGPRGAGKSRCLQEIADRTGSTRQNLGVELARQLLDLAVRDRPLRVATLVQTAVEAAADPVLLDNIEILFTPELRLSPLTLLQSLSRDRIVVASWPGTISGGHLKYAAPGHSEYRSYPAGELVTIQLRQEPAHRPA